MFVRTQDETLKLYETYCDMVYRICFLYLKNQQDAKDAVQETFLRLIKHPKKFENEAHAKSWLIVTASNYCKDVLKSFWHRKQVDGESFLLTEFSSNNDVPSNQELLDEVLYAVMRLPDQYKTIIYLYYYEGYQLGEIANILHVNPSTLRSRFAKAKLILRDTLREDTL